MTDTVNATIPVEPEVVEPQPVAETSTPVESVNTRKRGAESDETAPTDVKRAHVAPEDAVSGRVKRQIEYYLSDENLKKDKFFHKLISESTDGWLNMATIMSCKRISELNLTTEEVMQIMKNTSTAVEVNVEARQLRRVGGAPLPTLQPFEKRCHDMHIAGCIIRLDNVPEEGDFQDIRTALNVYLPEPTPKFNKEGVQLPPHKVAFVGSPNAAGSAYAFLNPFTNDEEYIKTNNTIHINGQLVHVVLVRDASEANKFISSLPNRVKETRLKTVKKMRMALSNRPISLGGQTFASVSHLRSCMKELIDTAELGQVINENAFNVCMDLLDYHHKGVEKKAGATAIKVDLSSFTDENNTPTRCFFLIKEDGSAVDFSMNICIRNLSANPPFVQTENAPIAAQETVVEDSKPEVSVEENKTEEPVTGEETTPEDAVDVSA